MSYICSNSLKSSIKSTIIKTYFLKLNYLRITIFRFSRENFLFFNSYCLKIINTVIMSVYKTPFETSSNLKNVSLAFGMICSLFFLWGFAISMLDGLNRKFQLLLHIDRAESAWVQICTFGAYFIMAIPAGMIIRKFGYKKGILLGLALYALGALAVYPALEYSGPEQAWTLFLICLFCIACGLAVLETAANPYTTVLGEPSTAPFRINLAQSFNGLGVIIGPSVAGLFLFADNPKTLAEGFDGIQLPYVSVGLLVVLVFILFLFVKLPEIKESENQEKVYFLDLLKIPRLKWGILAQFLNVGAQACVWGFFINYVVESYQYSEQKASYLLSIGMIIFTTGRFLSTLLLKKTSAGFLLGIYCLSICGLLLTLVFSFHAVALYALLAFFFFQSITFPTIFSLSIEGLGSQTKTASSALIMAIVGGAVFPRLMGYLADTYGIGFSFLLPVIMFGYIAWYSFRFNSSKHT
jgi:MFS transporter, FHS family, L-fucose permease